MGSMSLLIHNFIFATVENEPYDCDQPRQGREPTPEPWRLHQKLGDGWFRLDLALITKIS